MGSGFAKIRQLQQQWVTTETAFQGDGGCVEEARATRAPDHVRDVRLVRLDLPAIFCLRRLTKKIPFASLVPLVCRGDYQEWKWAYTLADTWRITHDICRSWSACAEPWFKSVTSIIDAASSLSSYQGPRKGWNDADMLQVGNPGLSKAEGKAHFGMWAGLKSPLIIGTDLRTIDAYHEEILLNSEVIAVNQDTKGRMATRVSRDAVGREIWAGPLSSPGRSCVVILLNRADSSKYFSFDFGLLASALGLSKAQIKARKFKIRDLFKKQDVAKAWPGKTAYSGAGKVEAHGIVMLKITQV